MQIPSEQELPGRSVWSNSFPDVNSGTGDIETETS